MNVENFVKHIHNKDFILKDKDFQLIRIKKSHIELIRNWRNSPEISQYMLTQSHISQEDQEKWFNKINNACDCFYFIIYHKNTPIGVIQLYDIDNNTAVVGLYIAHADYINSGYAFKAIFLLGDFAFLELELEQWNIQIKKNNKRAIRFDTAIGFKKVKESNSLVDDYILTKEDFFKNKNSLMQYLKDF